MFNDYFPLIIDVKSICYSNRAEFQLINYKYKKFIKLVRLNKNKSQ